MGFPGGSVDKESACNAGDLGLIPGLGGSLEKGMATHLAGESHRQKSLEGYSPWGLKESDMTERITHTHTHTETHTHTGLNCLLKCKVIKI